MQKWIEKPAELNIRQSDKNFSVSADSTQMIRFDQTLTGVSMRKWARATRKQLGVMAN